MKPIVIGITKDGKVDMTLDEFRKHIDDAYWQGYRDNTSSTLTNGNEKWWEGSFYCNPCITTDHCTASTNVTLTNKA